LEQRIFIGKINKILKEVRVDENFPSFFPPIQRKICPSSKADRFDTTCSLQPTLKKEDTYLFSQKKGFLSEGNR
jgi:hypothetical protein